MLTTCITPNIIKQAVYGRDPAFLRSIEMMRGLWSANGHLYGRLWNSASLLIRPDAIVGRRTASILSALRDQGLIPSAVRKVHLSSSSASALWRYQANVATKERLQILDLLMTSGPSLYVVLHDTCMRQSAPACVHLTYLKGPSIAARRRPLHLRSLAGPPVANILTYLHGSDDPADFIREMAVLFDVPAQAEILAELDQPHDRTSEALQAIAQLEREAPKGLLEADFNRDLCARTPPRQLADRTDLAARSLKAHWRHIVHRAHACRSFLSGETYDVRAALVPDSKELSLPLDGHLVFDAFGPRP